MSAHRTALEKARARMETALGDLKRRDVVDASDQLYYGVMDINKQLRDRRENDVRVNGENVNKGNNNAR